MHECESVCVWRGVLGGFKDQYIISYKLNSTWIDPEGVCDRLRTVDECTVNPTDQHGGTEGKRVGGWESGGGVGLPPLTGGVYSGVRRHEELGFRGGDGEE